MLELIQSVNSAVNNFIWGVPAMICIIGVGLLLTIKTKFLQIRKFPYAMKETLGRVFKEARMHPTESMTPFSRQSVLHSLPQSELEILSGVAGCNRNRWSWCCFSGCGFLLFLECVRNFPK